MKSTPANLNMQVTSGISQDDLTCLGMMPENPEDRVKSDQRRDKKTPKASFVLISDLLKAILDRPELSSNKTLAMHLIAMYLTGKFVKPFERKVTKRNILSVGICNVKTYKALTYEYEAFDRLVNAGLKLGMNFERCESRLLPIKALPEFSIIMRVFLLIDQGHAMDKACAMVGASTSTVAMIANALQPPSLASTTKWAANTVAFPQHTVTRSIAYEQHVEYIDKQRATPTERIEVPAGTYRMDAMLRICKLLGSSETTANQKHLTTAVPETNAIKVLLSAGGYGYKIIAGENYFVRYRGKRVPVAGISASKD